MLTTTKYNPDRDIWIEVGGESFYTSRIFVTQDGNIGIEVGGLCIVKSIREWHKLAWPQHNFVESNGGTDRQCTECGAIDCSSAGDYWCSGKRNEVVEKP